MAGCANLCGVPNAVGMGVRQGSKCDRRDKRPSNSGCDAPYRANPHSIWFRFAGTAGAAVPLTPAEKSVKGSVDCEGDDVVAAFVVKLRISAGANYDVLLAAHRVGRRWRVYASAGLKHPQSRP